MYKRHVKFGLNIHNCLGKMPENFKGGFFLTYTVVILLLLLWLKCSYHRSSVRPLVLRIICVFLPNVGTVCVVH